MVVASDGGVRVMVAVASDDGFKALTAVASDGGVRAVVWGKGEDQEAVASDDGNG